MQVKENMQVSSELLALYALKSLPIDVEYEKDENGTICCWTNNGIETWGYGPTYEEAREDLLHGLKDIADIIRYEVQNGEDEGVPPENKLYMLRILLSSDEELRQCLSCENIDDI